MHLKAAPAFYEGLFEKVISSVWFPLIPNPNQVKYYVTGTLDESVQTILEGGGAKKTAYLSGINTHCIVGSEPDYNEVVKLMVLYRFCCTCAYGFIFTAQSNLSGCRSVKLWTCWTCPVCSRNGFTPLFFARSFCLSGADLTRHKN